MGRWNWNGGWHGLLFWQGSPCRRSRRASVISGGPYPHDRPGGVPSVGAGPVRAGEVYSVALDGKMSAQHAPCRECFGSHRNLLAGAELETVLRCGEGNRSSLYP